MTDNVLYIHAVVPKLDKGNHSQIVAADVDYPPFIPVPEVIQTGENLSQFIWCREVTIAQGGVHMNQRIAVIGVQLGCVIKGFARDYVHN